MSWGSNKNYKHNPCWDCPKKGCGAYHDICPINKAWKDKNEAMREAKNKHLDLVYALNELGNHRVSTRKR